MLHDTQSVTIRPLSGPQGWTWELDSIEPEVGPEQSKFADVTNVVARLQQQFDPRSLMTRFFSIITGVAVLAIQAAFLIALHFVLH